MSFDAHDKTNLRRIATALEAIAAQPKAPSVVVHVEASSNVDPEDIATELRRSVALSLARRDL